MVTQFPRVEQIGPGEKVIVEDFFPFVILYLIVGFFGSIGNIIPYSLENLIRLIEGKCS